MTNQVRQALENDRTRMEIAGVLSACWTKPLEAHQGQVDDLQWGALADKVKAETISRVRTIWNAKIVPKLGLPSVLVARNFIQAFRSVFLKRTV